MPRLPRPLRILTWSLAAVITLAIAAHFATPPLARHLIERAATHKLKRTVSVGAVELRLLQLSATIRDLTIREADGSTPAAGFSALFVDLDGAPLLQGRIPVAALRLEGPWIKAIRTAPNHYNFSDAIDALLAEPSDGPPPDFVLRHLEIDGGKVEFDDRPLARRHLVSDIRISLPFLSNLAEDRGVTVHSEFSAKVNGHPVALRGEAHPYADQQEARIDLEAKDIDLPRYLAYLPTKLPVTLTRGTLDGKISVKFAHPHGKPATLALNGQASLRDAALHDGEGAPLGSLARLTVKLDNATPLAADRAAAGSVELAGVNFAERQVGPVEAGAGELSGAAAFRFSMTDGQPQVLLDQLNLALARPALRLPGARQAFFSATEIRLDDARLDLAGRDLAIAALSVAGGKFSAQRLSDGSLDLARLAANPKTEGGETAPGAPWRLALGKLDLSGWGIRWEDRQPAQAVTVNLEPFAATLENLSSDPAAGARLNLTATLNGKGKFSANGEVFPLDKRGKLALNLGELELGTFLPYFAERLNLTWRQGTLSAKGNLDFALPAGGAPQIAFAGEATLGSLHTLDAAGSADLLKWKSLYFGELRAATPATLSVGEIALADFYARIAIDPQGQLNLQQLLRPAAAPTAPPAAAGPAPEIRIGKVTLQGGTVQFSDRYIKPNYSARLTDIGGKVAALNAGIPAEIDLRGRLDGAAPLQIGGRLDPLGKDLYADIKAAVKGIELTSLSPYAAKYAGYAIDKGKLSLDVHYRIENRKLEAENHLFLDQLTFGEKVDSPSATKLPVLLAVSLLKNAKGEIDLHLPVGGSLDDPQFSVGEIVGTLLGNLVWKTVSAPFAFLASLFGGDSETLGWLDFTAGRANIGAASETKLTTLAKALAEKPGVNLEIAGHADAATDREGLKQARLERKLKTLKNADLAKQGNAAAGLDALSIAPEEYPALLKRVYLQENFPKPRNFLGLPKELPNEEMEKLLLANTPASDDDLVNLANRRAKAAREWFLEKAGVAPERVFLLAPKLAKTDEKTAEDSKKPPARVEFSLKN